MAINQSELSSIYVGLIGRPLDGSGYKNWTEAANFQHLNLPATYNVILTNELVQELLRDKITTNKQFVEHLYNHLLGKTYTQDPDGINAWIAQLDQGVSRGEVLDGIVRTGANPVFAQDRNETTRNAHKLLVNRIRASNIIGDITTDVDLTNGLQYGLAPYIAIQSAITPASTLDDIRTLILRYASQIRADVGKLPSSMALQTKAKVIRELTGITVSEDYDIYKPDAAKEEEKKKKKCTEDSNTIDPILNSFLAKRLDTLELDAKNITNGSVYSKEFNGIPRLFWEGIGPFDIFMRALDENIRSQLDNGRIEGTDYAVAYTKILELALTKAIEVETLNQEFKIKVLDAKLKAAIAEEELKFKKKELAFREKQLEAELQLLGLKQENMRAQTKVLDRQVDGFSDNLKLKLFQAQLETFGMIYSQGMLDFDETSSQFPEVLKASKVSETYNMLHESATKNWDYDPVKGKSLYPVETRIAKGGPESAIKL
nr:MAG TPA: Phycobilisome Linker polypeptide [Caudoviricetes sp.]